jgi:sec-independent protein translocase protein TatC
VLYELFAFVSPALYDKERRPAVKVVACAYAMFILGTLVNYFIVFPLTVRFLGTYQVSPDVTNMLTIQSYADTLISMSLVLGIVFELPVVSWLLAMLGIIGWEQMARLRKHALVVILVVSAIITPTTDAFTLFVVALPIWLLYEASIIVVRITRRKKGREVSSEA